METVKSFVMNSPAESKSKDELTFTYSGITTTHYASLVAKVHCYRVINETKKNKGLSDYENFVYFWLSQYEKLQIASCSCRSVKVCKHIIKGYELHKTAIQTGLITE